MPEHPHSILFTIALDLHPTHMWSTLVVVGKVNCLNPLHGSESCSFTASCTLIPNSLKPASYSVALPSLIPSTQTASCYPKPTISHERITLKITAEAVVSQFMPCDNIHSRPFSPSNFKVVTRNKASKQHWLS